MWKFLSWFFLLVAFVCSYLRWRGKRTKLASKKVDYKSDVKLFTTETNCVVTNTAKGYLLVYFPNVNLSPQIKAALNARWIYEGQNSYKSKTTM